MFFLSSPIEYEGPVFRPPSEAASLLIQVTIGCSHNKCTFCAMYNKKKYRERSIQEISEDIYKARDWYQKIGEQPKRVFFCDGDALGADTSLLLKASHIVNNTFPELDRIGVYATCENILEKSVEELSLLSKNKINIAYLGLESGSDEVLSMIVKGNDSKEMVQASKKIIQAGFKLSVICMLGVGGRALSKIHCSETSKVVSQMSPDYFSFLTTTVVPNTPYHRAVEKKEIELLTTKELLQEMYAILSSITSINNQGIIFRANHVSNQFPLAGILPYDNQKLLDTLDKWIHQCPEGTYPDLDPSRL